MPLLCRCSWMGGHGSSSWPQASSLWPRSMHTHPCMNVTKQRHIMFLQLYSDTHIFYSNLPHISQNNPAMFKCHHWTRVVFNKPLALGLQNSACSGQLTAWHSITMGKWYSWAVKIKYITINHLLTHKVVNVQIVLTKINTLQVISFSPELIV